jgi:hypothetical protein
VKWRGNERGNERGREGGREGRREKETWMRGILTQFDKFLVRDLTKHQHRDPNSINTRDRNEVREVREGGRDVEALSFVSHEFQMFWGVHRAAVSDSEGEIWLSAKREERDSRFYFSDAHKISCRADRLGLMESVLDEMENNLTATVTEREREGESERERADLMN